MHLIIRSLEDHVNIQVLLALAGFSKSAKVNCAAGCADVECKDATSIPQAVQAVDGADATNCGDGFRFIN